MPPCTPTHSDAYPLRVTWPVSSKNHTGGTKPTMRRIDWEQEGKGGVNKYEQSTNRQKVNKTSACRNWVA